MKLILPKILLQFSSLLPFLDTFQYVMFSNVIPVETWVSSTPTIAFTAADSYTLSTIPWFLVAPAPAMQFVCTGLQNTSALNQSVEQNYAVSDSPCNMSEHGYTSLMLQNIMAEIYYSYNSLVDVYRRARDLPIQKLGHSLYLSLILILSLFLPIKFHLSSKLAFFRKERNNTPGDLSDLLYTISRQNKDPDICQKQTLCRLLDTCIWKIKNCAEIRSI